MIHFREDQISCISQNDSFLATEETELLGRQRAAVGFGRSKLRALVDQTETWVWPTEKLQLDRKMKISLAKSREVLLQQFQTIAQKLKEFKRPKRNWSSEEVNFLFAVILLTLRKLDKPILNLSLQQWNEIGTIVPGRESFKCMFKWLTFRKFSLSDFPWSVTQDEVMRQFIQNQTQNQVNWLQLSQVIYLKNYSPNAPYRSAKQCRQHWTFHLENNLKRGFWSRDEDIQLLELFFLKGKRWYEMSKSIQNRTQNSIKNRFNLLLQKCNKDDSQQLQALSQLLTVLKRQKNLEEQQEDPVQELCDGIKSMSIEPSLIRVNQLDSKLQFSDSGFVQCYLDMDSMIIYYNDKLIPMRKAERSDSFFSINSGKEVFDRTAKRRESEKMVVGPRRGQCKRKTLQAKGSVLLDQQQFD